MLKRKEHEIKWCENKGVTRLFYQPVLKGTNVNLLSGLFSRDAIKHLLVSEKY